VHPSTVTASEDEFWAEHNEDVVQVLISEDASAQSSNMRGVPLIFAHAEKRPYHLSQQNAADVGSILKWFFHQNELPPHLFSARSYRIGHAGTAIKKHVSSDANPSRHYSLTDIQELLTTTSHWASARQASVYIKHVREQLSNDAETDLDLSGEQWIRAVDSIGMRAAVMGGGYEAITEAEWIIEQLATAASKHVFLRKLTMKKVQTATDAENAARFIYSATRTHNLPEEDPSNPIDIPQLAQSIQKLNEHIAHERASVRTPWNRNRSDFHLSYVKRPAAQFRFLKADADDRVSASMIHLLPSSFQYRSSLQWEKALASAGGCKEGCAEREGLPTSLYMAKAQQRESEE